MKKNVKIAGFLMLIPALLFKNNVTAQADDCDKALLLTSVSNYCSGKGEYTNATANPSGYAAAGCWGGTSGSDVWFKFVATGTDILLSVFGNDVNGSGTMVAPKIALYTGCSTNGDPIFQHGCAIADPGNNFVNLYKGGLIIGQTYLVRVSSGTKGTFQFCANCYVPPPVAGQDCATAGLLCSKDPVSFNQFNGAGTDKDEGKNTCIGTIPNVNSEQNSIWYYWVAKNNGTLTFSITPVDTNDIDFVLYELPSGISSCATRTKLRCNASYCKGINGSTGINLTSTDLEEDSNCDPGEDGFVKYIDMVQGKTYALLINEFEGIDGFTLTFGGTGEFQGPEPAFSMSATSICDTLTPVTFTNQTQFADSIMWHFGEGASIDSSDQSGPHTVTYNSTGIKTIVLESWSNSINGFCHVVESKTIEVKEKPKATFTPPSGQCVSSNSFAFSTTGAPSGVTYSWNFGDNATSSSAAPSHSYTAAGTYPVKITLDLNGCKQDLIDSVQVFPSPKVDFTPDDDKGCLPHTVKFSNKSTSEAGSTYKWSFESGGTSADKDPSVTFSQPVSDGKYDVKLIITSPYGCKDSLSDVIYEDTCKVEAPNVFTPNGDGYNDKLVFKDLEHFKNPTLIIYNRWGRRMYESDDYKNDWDANGISEGTYYYILSFDDFDGITQKMHGYLTILKE